MIDRSKLPFGGESILVSRMRKVKPEKVFVSLLPASVRLNVEPFALVRAIPTKTYDWRFLHQVDTVIVCNQEQQSVQLFDQLAQQCKPLAVWFLDEKVGYDIYRLPDPGSIEGRSPEDWKWTLDLTPWHRSMNTEWLDWMEQTVEGSYVQHIA